MAKLQYDSMRVPYSIFSRGILWTGEYLLVIPMDAEGGLMPYMEQIVGTRGPKFGRKKWLDTSKHTPHQSTRECERRLRTYGHDMPTQVTGTVTRSFY